MAVLRLAKSTDTKVIKQLVRVAFQRWIDVLGREPEPIRADYKSAIISEEVWVIEDDGGLKAVMKFLAEMDALFIDVLAVHPDDAGRGHGSKLLIKAQSLALNLGKRKIRLKTVSSYLDNLVFYGRRGFCIKECVIHNGTPVLSMEKEF